MAGCTWEALNFHIPAPSRVLPVSVVTSRSVVARTANGSLKVPYRRRTLTSAMEAEEEGLGLGYRVWHDGVGVVRRRHGLHIEGQQQTGTLSGVPEEDE